MEIRNKELKIEEKNNDKSTVRLLGQKISVERKALKIGNSDDFSNGFTPPFTPFE